MFEYNRDGVRERIRSLREKRDMTLKEFSEYLDIPVSSINSWERGVSIPRPNYLKLLADKNDVSESWILYGDVEDYVTDVLVYLNIYEIVSEKEFFDIVNLFNKRKVSVGNYNEFATIAREVIDNFDEMLIDEEKSFIPYIKPERIASQFQFLKDIEVQQEYLPFLNDLLSEKNIKQNGPIFLFLIDTLSRMNDDTKPLLNRIMRDINWLVTNNVLFFEKTAQSEDPKYYGVNDSSLLMNLQQREWDEIESELNERISGIESKLNSIVELNYEKQRNSKTKSIYKG
ncbi:helix-turn-helix domain-containing protein [Amphibacillus sediminis]|uniref:helix-turn-helix domain-containing protein n=1 Tax=Amphibacillus sediminis TaxID=360185 RepID=UPI00082B4422|nr:helix-turn-helix transcriptional regulator [Amphibacillus sediminis]